MTWGDRLLRQLLPRGVRGDAIAGDLLEEWDARGRTRAASIRYWRQAASIVVRYAWRRERRNEPADAGRRRTRMLLDNLLQDVRFALRSYAKAPSYAVIMLVTLALGIGASTAIFSMVNGILLRPLPLPDPDRLIYANEVNVNQKGRTISLSFPNYRDWRARARSFTALAASREEPLTLTGLDHARRIRARRVTGNFFRVLSVAPALGRELTDEDDRAGAAPAVILSDGFWQSAFAGDPAVVGRVLTLNDTPYTVVGVMPPRFEYLRPYDAFVSMSPVAASRGIATRGDHTGYYATGRLRPGVAVETASHELQGIAAQLEQEYPATNTSIGVLVEPLAARMVSNVRATLLALFGAVACLLLIACVNVAGLLVARGAARQHELAVRAALGGGRLRLATQLLVDSSLLSAAGGALGLVLATALLRALVAAAPEGTPRIGDVRIDGAAMLFAFAAAAICGLIFGAFPAFQAAGTDVQQALIRGRAAGFASRSHHVRRGLIVVETALAIVLLVGAGLMVRTVQQLIGVDIGFRPDHVLTTRLSLSGKQWTEERLLPFYSEFVSRVRAIPGVSHAALTYSLPIDGSQWNSVFISADKPVPQRSQLPSAAFTPVSEGFFETMGIRRLRGRGLAASDTSATAPVVVINETLARTLWPGEDAVGKRIKQGWPESKSAWREVVGVVADVKFNGINSETPLQIYLPVTQESSNAMILVARTTVDSTSITSAVEAVAREMNRDMPLYLTATMDDVLSSSIAQQRMSVIVLATFAVVALTLASVGLYGVISHGVTERTHEIGVRMALGAGAPDVLRMVVTQGLTTAAAGVALGIGAALALSRVIEDLLFGVTAQDPITFAAVTFTLFLVALVACSIPAWRAARLNPTTALRSE